MAQSENEQNGAANPQEITLNRSANLFNYQTPECSVNDADCKAGRRILSERM